MTITELCNCDAATLASITDAQLLEWFKPFLNVTRPELAPKPKSAEPPQMVMYLTPQKKAALAALKQADPDMDLSFLTKRKR